MCLLYDVARTCPGLLRDHAVRRTFLTVMYGADRQTAENVDVSCVIRSDTILSSAS
jgi:hypothetical protein